MEGYPGYRATSRVKIVEEAGRAYLVVRRKKAKTIITSGQKYKTLASTLCRKTQPCTKPTTRPPTYKQTSRTSTPVSRASRNSAIVCEYNLQLQQENQMLKKQNSMLYQYIRTIEKPTDMGVCQRYREMKRQFFDESANREHNVQAEFMNTTAADHH